MNYYMIRPRYFNNACYDIFTKKNIVAVGWSDFDFSKYDNIEELFPEIHYLKDVAPTTAGKWKNQIRRFKNLQDQDKIIIPFGNKVLLAAIDGNTETFSKEDAKHDQANQRKAKYFQRDGRIIEIPRNHLSERLQRRLRVRGNTIANLWEFENELNDVFKMITDIDYEYSWKGRFKAIEEKKIDLFKKKLLQNIRNGNTNLQTGGIGLERLVKELLENEGYTAKIESKRAFPDFADADIVAKKSDFIGDVELLIQIKHHWGNTSDWGVTQLLSVLNAMPKEFETHKLVIITSANASEILTQKCDEHDIKLIDGNDLAEWLYLTVKTLKEDTLDALGISLMPSMLDLKS
jgi:restriction system protein